jgi:uncharacterized membrane protein SpoIIM required for sporulation
MSFIIALILLTGMGLWVGYQLFLLLRRRDTKIAEIKRKPLLSLIILIAQLVFLIACLYKIYYEFF